MSHMQQQRVQIGVNDLGTTHPEIAAQRQDKNGTLTPQSVV